MVFHDRPHVRAAVGRVRHEPVAGTMFGTCASRHSRWRSLPSTSSPMWPCTGVPCPVWCRAGHDARIQHRVCTPTPGSDEPKAPCRDPGQCQRGEGRTAADESHGRTLRRPESVVSARLQQPLFGQGIGRQTSNNWGHYELVSRTITCGFQLILWWKFFQVDRHLTSSSPPPPVPSASSCSSSLMIHPC